MKTCGKTSRCVRTSQGDIPKAIYDFREGDRRHGLPKALLYRGVRGHPRPKKGFPGFWGQVSVLFSKFRGFDRTRQDPPQVFFCTAGTKCLLATLLTKRRQTNLSHLPLTNHRASIWVDISIQSRKTRFQVWMKGCIVRYWLYSLTSRHTRCHATSVRIHMSWNTENAKLGI